MERAKLGWQHAVAVSVATSPKLTHHLEVNEFVRLAVEAQAAGGVLSYWYGERWLHRAFAGRLLPDSYAALGFPDRPALHMLVELDRGTETLETLRLKTKRTSKRSTTSSGARSIRSCCSSCQAKDAPAPSRTHSPGRVRRLP